MGELRLTFSFQEEHFYQRPSIRITLPDNLKALLVDDWENITKNQQVVSLPATHSVNQILDAYAEEERAKRGVNSADRDVLDEVIMGLKEYFDKTLDKLLLYRFEREQYRTLRQKWESGGRNSTYKGPLDVYGAHHLTRLFGRNFLLLLFLLSSPASFVSLMCFKKKSDTARTHRPDKHGPTIHQPSARGTLEIYSVAQPARG